MQCADEMRRQIDTLRETTATGRLQKQVDELTLDRDRSKIELKTLAEELATAESDKGILAMKVH